MSVGKAASQSGHAFIGAFLKADNARQSEYHRDGIGTKICLAAPSLQKLRWIFQEASDLGLPCTLIEDTGHNTCFHGVPTITAVGIGPIRKSEFPILKHLALAK